nr:long-chain fatty acid--CoA ligase [Deltaproteobacteria bacterium]
ELFGVKSTAPGATDGWKWSTYAEFAEQVDAFRAALAALGVGPGDKVGIVSDNRPEWAIACYATYGLRAAFVPMYEAQKPEEWEFILNDSAARVVIGSRQDTYEKLLRVRDNVPSLTRVIGMDLAEGHADRFATLLGQGRANPVRAEHPTWDEIAGFIYTSGTTGKPKGVILSHGNICSNINAIHSIFTFESTDRSLSFLPWAHSFGQTCELHGLLSMGASMAINDDVPNLLPNLAVVKPTILFAVPRIFNRVYDNLNKQMAERPAFIRNLFYRAIAARTKVGKGEAIGMGDKIAVAIADRLVFTKVRERLGGRLKYAISGSAALNRDVAQFIDALGIEVYEGYGLTETSPIATANFPGNRKIGSVGKAIPEVRIVIDRSVTGDAENGEILVYGPNVMKGYHNRDDENAAVLQADAGFRTGDMGRLDPDGYLYITGRIKEQYKLENGKYVVPAPLEEEVKLSPYIANIMIHGANHEHNVALVVPDRPTLEKWAQENGVTNLEGDPKVHALLLGEIAKYGGSLKSYERPKKLLVTMEDFTTDNGMLTPTLKLKRRNVLAKYESGLEALYP